MSKLFKNKAFIVGWLIGILSVVLSKYLHNFLYAML